MARGIGGDRSAAGHVPTGHPPIEPPRIGIDFDRDPMFRTSCKNPFHIQFIARPTKQLSSHRMTKDRRVRVGKCPQNSLGLRILVKTKTAMNAGHDKVKPRQDVVGIIEGTVAQYIGLNAFEDVKLTSICDVQPVDFFVLFFNFCDA